MLDVKRLGNRRWIIIDDEDLAVSDTIYSTCGRAELAIERIENDDTCYYCGNTGQGFFVRRETEIKYIYAWNSALPNKLGALTDQYSPEAIMWLRNRGYHYYKRLSLRFAFMYDRIVDWNLEYKNIIYHITCLDCGVRERYDDRLFNPTLRKYERTNVIYYHERYKDLSI